tara:strand:+ start:344 stop:1189 length:846 start_codon:yes stop_codon:yes gene_type:complete
MKHNKKRNVGIIYELLLNYISVNLVEDNKKNASKALRIIEKRFNNKTELYKEFRLFNALAKTKVANENVAVKILNEAKDAIRRCDHKAIDHEKSRLIRDINHILEDKGFYYSKVKNYRELGTIQQLFNEWSKGDRSNLKNILILEEKVTSFLMQENASEAPKEIDPNLADNLVLKIMTEKLNNRYKDNLNEEQKKIIQNYSLYHTDNHHGEMRSYLNQLKEATLSAMITYKKETDSEILKEKLDTVLEKVGKLDTDAINDELISRFMTVSKLKYELLKEGK